MQNLCKIQKYEFDIKKTIILNNKKYTALTGPQSRKKKSQSEKQAGNKSHSQIRIRMIICVRFLCC
jgi:hypothetical protein